MIQSVLYTLMYRYDDIPPVYTRPGPGPSPASLAALHSLPPTQRWFRPADMEESALLPATVLRQVRILLYSDLN